MTQAGKIQSVFLRKSKRLQLNANQNFLVSVLEESTALDVGRNYLFLTLLLR